MSIKESATMRRGVKKASRYFLALLVVAWWAPAWATPDIQHWKTDNGVKVLFVEAHELPIVQVQITFDAGSARDTMEKAGVAQLTNGLLTQGVTGMNADQIAEHFDSLGAELGNASLRDMALLQLRSLSDENILQPALDVFTKLYTQPSFPDDAVQREIGLAKLSVLQGESQPGTIASKAFYKALYGDHPYAIPPGGTKESLEKITRDDLVAFHKRYYNSGNAVLAIVGDLSKRQAKKIANELTQGLRDGEAAPEVPEVPALEEAFNERVDFPSTQTHFLMGQPGDYRTDPDYFALYVGNYILGGGGLVSMISQEVREKNGLAYSAYSYFSPMRRKGPFVVGLQTKNSQIDKAEDIAKQVVEDFVKNGPTEEQLVAAKKHITGGFPLNIDSNKKIAGYLGVIGFYDLPLTYLDDFNDTINALTVEQIRDAFQCRIHPDKMATIIVGGEG